MVMDLEMRQALSGFLLNTPGMSIPVIIMFLNVLSE